MHGWVRSVSGISSLSLCSHPYVGFSDGARLASLCPGASWASPRQHFLTCSSLPQIALDFLWFHTLVFRSLSILSFMAHALHHSPWPASSSLRETLAVSQGTVLRLVPSNLEPPLAWEWAWARSICIQRLTAHGTQRWHTTPILFVFFFFCTNILSSVAHQGFYMTVNDRSSNNNMAEITKNEFSL